MKPKKMNSVLVWHFAGPKLRDGSPHPEPGYSFPTITNPVPCERGYHGSEDISDALSYAQGTYLCRRRLYGTIIPHGNPVDKLCASNAAQETLYVDVSDILRAFARFCAWQARQYAASALDKAGLNAQAAKLRAFPQDCDLLDARDAAWAAGDEARAAARAAGDEARAAARVAWAAGTAAGDAAVDAGAAALASARAGQRAWLLDALAAKGIK